MKTDQRKVLSKIRRFEELVPFLRDHMGWPIELKDFEELVFEYTPEELGIDSRNAAKIQEINRLRPLEDNQPWGIFFVKFEPKRLPVVALRRILSQVAQKKSSSANNPEIPAWNKEDLLFISNFGEGDRRQISFAHFSKPKHSVNLPTLKVLGWDSLDTPLHLDDVAEKLTSNLSWPEDDSDEDSWRNQWRSSFTLGHREVINTSQQLSKRLAELARNIRDRIVLALSIETKDGPLSLLLKDFQNSLIQDLNNDKFADMYAQTITYGLLSMRITDPEKKTVADLASSLWTTPFLKELLETFIKAGGRHANASGVEIDFDELGVSEVVELLDQANMEAVVRDFGDRNPQEDPVIHFYEHFLRAYNKKQKIKRGVFYTPRPVVSYIVRSVDELLRSEFGLEDGLADTATWNEMIKKTQGVEISDDIKFDQAFVQILDPATGTGTFLVEVIDFIYNTMCKKWMAEGHDDKTVKALWKEYVPKHLLPRLHGYEIMMAPYAIAHLKIGLKLYETGYEFGKNDRVRVYLTNALEPATDLGQQILEGVKQALAHESIEVNKIKKDSKFSVVIGNPPYSRSSQNEIQHNINLLEDYKFNLGEKNFNNLNDDHIKFIRFAHDRVESAGAGIVGMITNNIFIDGLTHSRMREVLHKTFPFIRILDLHGNAKKKVVAEDGSEDENVFGINQVGVAVSMLCLRLGEIDKKPIVSFGELRGSRTEKYKQLLKNPLNYSAFTPFEPDFFFVPKDLGLYNEFKNFVPITEIFRNWSSGIATCCDPLAISFDRDEMLSRAHFLIENNNEEVSAKFDLSCGMQRIEEAREEVARIENLEKHLRRVLYRPFDVRWTVYTGKSNGFHGRPRWKTMQHMLADNNLAMLATRQVRKKHGEHTHIGAANLLVDLNCSHDGVCVFPLYQTSFAENLDSLAQGGRHHNLRQEFLNRLDTSNPVDAFTYAFATLSSLSYRTRYAELLKIGFPKIPLPCSADLFFELARLGSELADLHSMSSFALGNVIPEYVGPQNPVVGNIGWSDSTVWLNTNHTCSAREGYRALTSGTVGFRGVPEEVWDFRIGGYQVCHNWLKDRKGRQLSSDDINHYQKVVGALSEIIRLIREIDEVIDQHGGWPKAFVTK